MVQYKVGWQGEDDTEAGIKPTNIKLNYQHLNIQLNLQNYFIQRQHFGSCGFGAFDPAVGALKQDLPCS